MGECQGRSRGLVQDAGGDDIGTDGLALDLGGQQETGSDRNRDQGLARMVADCGRGGKKNARHIPYLRRGVTGQNEQLTRRWSVTRAT